MQQTLSETIKPQIEESWKKVLSGQFDSASFKSLRQFLLDERQQGHTIYPPGNLIFNAFNTTPFHQVKVVILGQDPYHGPGQANGLCFSVADHIPVPPSLQNIFKELRSDLGIPVPASGNLIKWAQQGVLMLNATLTVRASAAGSHQNKGWEQFTDSVIRSLSEQKTKLVFLLWGKFAQAKATLIDHSKHHILTAAHPSPFSAYNGFFGCRHFSVTNDLLAKNGLEPIDWNPA